MGSGAFLVEATRQLAERLVTAWEVHDVMPEVPPDEEPVLHARRLVAQRCIYGVDKNPFAVNLAKLSIWLVTLAKDHAFTFIDHALKHGDSLVGLTKKQIAAFHWKTDSGPALDLFERKLKQDIEAALGWRDALQGLDEGDYNQKKEAWWEAENALSDARLIGDLVVAAFFGADKGKAREKLRNQYRIMVEAWQADKAIRQDLEAVVENLRGGNKPVPPMHWEIEYPEVFGRENPGFDAMVGNPPFLKGSAISGSFGSQYLAWLKNSYDASGGQADLVAYFFQRAFFNARADGCTGLLGTQTIAQGATKKGSLEYLLGAGGVIFHAVRRIKWQGGASVNVSCVHTIKQPSTAIPCVLDGKSVERISAYLGSGMADAPPLSLSSNKGIAFMGYYPYGEGFLFSDGSVKTTSISEMDCLLESSPHYAAIIHPYIGGEEFLDHPRQEHRRYVLSLENMSEADARDQYPEAMTILEEKVLPFRKGNRRARLRQFWWQYGEQRPGLAAATKGLKRILMHPYVNANLAFAFVSGEVFVGSPHYAFALESMSSFASLQTRVHEVWARHFSSSFKDDLTYTASMAFDTFPFSKSWQDNPTLEGSGENYYEYRADLMVRNDEGLTKTYNRFHNPDNHEPDTVKLRELHAAMDRAVLDAYGWDDIPTDCDFLLDYEIDEDTWGNKKKPYRYRCPDEVHDEVLARLLDLNQKRYQEEVAAGLHDKKGKKKAPKKKAKSKAAAADATLPLFGSVEISEDE